MLIKVVAAAIAAIFLLVGNSALAAVPWGKIDPQQAAAPLVRMAYAVATGGNAKIECRDLHWGPEDCAAFVDNLRLSMRAVAGPILSKHARQTGLYPADQQRLDSIMADSSDAILQLAAMLPPGEMGRCVVQKYDAALHNVVNQHHRRLLKRNSKRASKESRENGAANTQIVTAPAGQKELKVPGANTKVDAERVAAVKSLIHKTIRAVEKHVQELPISNSDDARRADEMQPVARLTDREHPVIDPLSIERAQPSWQFPKSVPLGFRSKRLYFPFHIPSLVLALGCAIFLVALLHNLPDNWYANLKSWNEYEHRIFHDRRYYQYEDGHGTVTYDDYLLQCHMKWGHPVGYEDTLVCDWDNDPTWAPATAYFSELVGLILAGSGAWLLKLDIDNFDYERG